MTAFGDPTDRSGWLAGSTIGNATPNADPTSALRTERFGGHNFGVRYSGVLSSTWLIDANVGRHSQASDTEAATDAGRSVPRQIDETFALFEHGGFNRVQTDDASRIALGVKLTNVIAQHELRYGIDSEINNYDANVGETWYRFFGPSFGFGTYVQERIYSVVGKGSTNNTAMFVQDAWKVTPSVQLNLGMRYEQQRLDSANNVAISGESDAVACTVNLECRTTTGLRLNGNWAPRSGRRSPRKRPLEDLAFWGRFYEAIPLDMNIRLINGEHYIITQFVNPTDADVGQRVQPVGQSAGDQRSVAGPPCRRWSTSPRLDEDLKSQYEDQLIIGADYQFKPAWSIGARFINRELGRIIEDIGTFTNPDDPIELTGYVIGNPGEGFFGAPFEKPTRSYKALEVTLQRAYTNNWHLNSSFVYAKANGNHEGLYMSGYDQLDPNITALYDIPSFLPNSTGRLRSDKPYQFKMYGAYTFPWGLTVSEGFLLSAGVPVSTQGPEIVNGYGDGTIFLQPRGSAGRTPTYWNVDFHADYRLPLSRLGSARHLSVILDVFNLFNRNTTMERDSDYVYEGMDGIEAWQAESNLDAFGNPKFNPSLPASPYFNTPILFQAPRSMQVGVKFTF